MDILLILILYFINTLFKILYNDNFGGVEKFGGTGEIIILYNENLGGVEKCGGIEEIIIYNDIFGELRNLVELRNLM